MESEKEKARHLYPVRKERTAYGTVLMDIVDTAAGNVITSNHGEHASVLAYRSLVDSCRPGWDLS